MTTTAPVTRKANNLKRHDYFIWHNKLYYLQDIIAGDGFVIIEDCQTLETAFMKTKDFERMEVKYVAVRPS